MSSMTELCLFLAARAQHIEEQIVPLLHKNTIVLCDRYNDSSVAYQGYARELGIEEVIGFSSYVIKDVEPDLTLYLDIDPQIGLQRVSKYSKKNRYDRIESEKIVFHQKIREGFHLLARKYPHRFRIIDASMPIEDVFAQCYKHVDQTLRELGD
jgi:dTMP kinase